MDSAASLLPLISFKLSVRIPRPIPKGCAGMREEVIQGGVKGGEMRRNECRTRKEGRNEGRKERKEREGLVGVREQKEYLYCTRKSEIERLK